MNKINLRCNQPKPSWLSNKKYVVKACYKGKQKIIHFGAKGYGHNYNTAARRSFHARHKCHLAKNKLTARYWACKYLWKKGGQKKRCPSHKRCKKSVSTRRRKSGDKRRRKSGDKRKRSRKK